MYGRVSDPGVTLPCRGGAGSTNPGWGFHTMRGVIDSDDYRSSLVGAALYKPQIGLSTSWGAVSTRGNTVVVPDLL